MANKFFNTIKSAFIVVEETPDTAVKETSVITQNNTNPPITENIATTSINEMSVNSINQQLLDKLCKRLEEKNLPGPDYMELKTAMNDDFIKDAVPDETKRFGIAFKTLQATAPTLTKQHVLNSIDTYISYLNSWKQEAIDDINNKRSEVAGKKQEIDKLTQQMNELLKRRNELQVEVDETENKCNKNENDMVNAVNFLVTKLTEDKNKINMVLN